MICNENYKIAEGKTEKTFCVMKWIVVVLASYEADYMSICPLLLNTKELSRYRY